MSVNPKSLQCWVITEGMAGTENQCLGVAEALGVEPLVKRINLRAPWRWASPYLGFECAAIFEPVLKGPWPDLLIASGRKSIAASRYIKKQSGGKTFTVQIQDPRVSQAQFDLVAVPEHDSMRGANVIVTHAAPNRITEQKLTKAKTDFASQFAMLPSPRIAVMIGGDSKTHTMSLGGMEQLGTQLASLPGSLMLTASRRTSEAQRAALQKGLGDHPHYFWNGACENPYFGMLAWADTILVTADSVSMLGDAATTGKPVYMVAMEGGSTKFDRFHKHLQEYGAVRPFVGTLESWTYPPLQDSALVAAEIRRLMGLS